MGHRLGENRLVVKDFKGKVLESVWTARRQFGWMQRMLNHSPIGTNGINFLALTRKNSDQIVAVATAVLLGFPRPVKGVEFGAGGERLAGEVLGLRLFIDE